MTTWIPCGDRKPSVRVRVSGSNKDLHFCVPDESAMDSARCCALPDSLKTDTREGPLSSQHWEGGTIPWEALVELRLLDSSFFELGFFSSSFSSSSSSARFRRRDDTVGSPHRAQIPQFVFFELELLNSSLAHPQIEIETSGSPSRSSSLSSNSRRQRLGQRYPPTNIADR